MHQEFSQSDGGDGEVRSFVAVLLSGEVVEELLVLQRWLRSRVREDVRWLSADQLHLTLVFLGEVPPNQLTGLGDALEDVGRHCAGVRLHLQGAGVFPETGRPRVIWVGLGGDLESLAALHRQAGMAVTRYTPREETRIFRPHLTLGRLRPGGEAGPGLPELIGGLPGPRRVSWMVQQVLLMRSELTPAGARYTVLRGVPLRGAGGSSIGA